MISDSPGKWRKRFLLRNVVLKWARRYYSANSHASADSALRMMFAAVEDLIAHEKKYGPLAEEDLAKLQNAHKDLSEKT